MNDGDPRQSVTGKLVGFCLNNRLVVALVTLGLIVAGLAVHPFDWDVPFLPHDPVPVDAIPDIGANQQIVFTEWPGQSPREVDDQISYPLSSALLTVPGVKAVRGNSMFGFSSIYVIFADGVDFFWARSRLNEKLASLQPGRDYPDGVNPRLGPEATALGQVFWYTLEGRDKSGKPAGGWDLEELRTIQDWTVRYHLMNAEGVAEVASIGGFVREYQVDVDPDAMRAYDVTLQDVYQAVRDSNRDVGARTLEINQVEYFVRGMGYIRSEADIEAAVVTVRDNVPVLIRHVATVTLGPAQRRGALDKDGAEAVGGVVVARFGANPLQVIANVKTKIAELAPGMREKTLADGTVSKVTIVPFYDRTQLIHETLATLNSALTDEVLITIIVVVLMVGHLRGSVLIAGLLPVAVLMTFVAMKVFGIDANIVALSGIAIAIGTMVDMGIVVCENILRHMETAEADEPRLHVIHRAVGEVGGAVLTAVATTIVGFLPVLLLTGERGKLFRPLAFTKTFALIAAAIVALVVIPPAAYLIFRRKKHPGRLAPAGHGEETKHGLRRYIGLGVVVLIVGVLLSRHWRPVGGGGWMVPVNLLVVAVMVGGVLGLLRIFQRRYGRILAWCLAHKAMFLAIPLVLVVVGALVFVNLGAEEMPPLDEGSFLWMPSMSAHGSMGAALDYVSEQDKAFRAIPEIESVVGKIGRVDSPLDPAPISMIETVINYKPRDQWRPHLQTTDDLWAEIAAAGRLTGVSSAPKLQPIATRRIMLQTGMRSKMGLKIKGGSLREIEAAGIKLEKLLRQAPGVNPATVAADRIVGKPYIVVDTTGEKSRRAMDRYKLNTGDVLGVLEVAVGGKQVATTVMGRMRFPVRVRYPRELRDSVEAIGHTLVPTVTGVQVPLAQVADIRYEAGPQSIKREGGFIVGYVIFDGKPGSGEVDIVRGVRRFLDKKIDDKMLKLPPGMVLEYNVAGKTVDDYEADQRYLVAVVAGALLLIFIILYLKFRSSTTTLLVFSGILVAWAGGFVLLGLYGTRWFGWLPFVGDALRDLFNVHPINLSVAVWVGFLALFGIATDDGVVMATYLDQTFRRVGPTNVAQMRSATLEAGRRRVRPCLMTTATTILALLPVLTSRGRGSDIMGPMAVPIFGGMVIEVLTMLIVPVLYCWVREQKLRRQPGA